MGVVDVARTIPRVRRTVAVLLVAVALLASGCTEGPDVLSDLSRTLPPEEIESLVGDAEPAGFEVRPSVRQVMVTGAEPGTDLSLHDGSGRSVASGRADEYGALVFRLVEPGEGYRVATVSRTPEASATFPVLTAEESIPDQDFYSSQQLDEGFTYITTRDGTTLAASVFLPGPVEDGPYPTVVEYSGYSPAKPAVNLVADRWEAISGVLPEGFTVEEVCELAPFACVAPDQPGSLLAHALGYAVVAVNMRGTGCSGGSYDFFEELQVLDGYDIIETVAAQDWVKNNRVGMVGLSYPGLSQLFVASSAPPSLAAITALSVVDDVARGVLAPGGIFNEGFALQWAESVLNEAEPYGQGWEQDLVDAGDETCAENQRMRGQNVDAVEKARQNPYYDPEVADPINPSMFADRIDAAVFMGGSFQDEQTGGRFPMLFDDFANARIARFSAWNGAHADGFAPFNLVEWKTFLDFYVAEQLTERPPAVDLFVPLIMEEIFGAELSVPPQRMFEEYETFEEKRAAYEAEQPVRILLESGAGDPEQPGAPVFTTEVRADRWPLPGTTAGFWYFSDDGRLSPRPPSGVRGLASRFSVDEALAMQGTVKEGDFFRADIVYDWQHDRDGSAAVFLSEPLEEDVVMIGHGSVDLWVRSSADEADVGVTLSEVRPDSKETYIQSGVLRGSHRALAEGSTELLPLHDGLETSAEPMPAGEFTEMRAELFPFAHVFRAGSRIRISVHTPGGDKTRWTYILADHPPGTTIDVAHTAEMPSRLALPVVSGISGYPPEVPPDCGALRAQPCRDHRPYRNEVVQR
jgi:uncharacterized protein